MKQSKGLTVFVRDECANYNKHDEACLFDESCKVIAGERCDYFERAVLGPPDYKSRLPDYDYQKLFAKARGRCRLSIDVGTDGIADITKIGAAGRLVRD